MQVSISLCATNGRSIAIIGTSGRDPSRPLSRSLWLAMCADLQKRLNEDDHLISGGAAWSDHLAVHAYLKGWVSGLTLHLPAPIEAGTFAGPFKSSGSVLNFYHQKFSKIVEENTLEQLVHAINKGAKVNSQPVSTGYASMYAANKGIAESAGAVIAYTFEDGDAPQTGGTQDTWKRIQGPDRTHISLSKLIAQAQADEPPTQATASLAKELQMQNPKNVIAVIGTAGRDKTKPMTKELWQSMCADLKTRVTPSDHLISGGAAWADHLAVHAYLEGWVNELTLHLPAPLEGGKFVGPDKSAASAANYYHQGFSRAVGSNTLREIERAVEKGAHITVEPPSDGYGAMFRRNKKVALQSTGVIAYTFGDGDKPADGGTQNTWDQVNGDQKVHVPLAGLSSKPVDAPDVPVLTQPEPAPQPRKRFSFSVPM